MEAIGRALVLGAVQGVTEFLPVSSSGHLVLVRAAFGWPDEGSAFDAVLHLGTLVAVLVFFRSTFRELLHGRAPRLLRALVLSTLPAAAVGLLGRSFLAFEFRTLAAIGLGFFGTALILRLADRHVAVRPLPDSARAAADLSPAAVLLIGLAQAVALAPGVSRAGLTIAAGLLLGLSRERAVEFSFLLAAPVLAGAGLAALWSVGAAAGSITIPLGVGFLAAAVTGVAAIRFLLRTMRRRTLTPYALYLAVLAVVLLLRG